MSDSPLAIYLLMMLFAEVLQGPSRHAKNLNTKYTFNGPTLDFSEEYLTRLRLQCEKVGFNMKYQGLFKNARRAQYSAPKCRCV
jgi:hypothetical protein